MCGGGFMQYMAVGCPDVYYNNNSTTFHRGKINKFQGKRNFYKHIKNKGIKTHYKFDKIINKHKGPVINEYDGTNNNYRYEIKQSITYSVPNHLRLFNNDKVYINKRLYINNNRTYTNFQLLFQYSKSYNYKYITNIINDIFKTTI